MVISRKTIIFQGLQTFSRGGGATFSREKLISIETHITCDFWGGGLDPLSPSGSAHGVSATFSLILLTAIHRKNKVCKCYLVTILSHLQAHTCRVHSLAGQPIYYSTMLFVLHDVYHIQCRPPHGKTCHQDLRL